MTDKKKDARVPVPLTRQRLAKLKQLTPWKVDYYIMLTPELAQEFLASSRGNVRNVTMPRMEALARSCKDGRYQKTHESLGIDPSGHLFDGHNRCTAVVMSGAATPMVVSYFVESEWDPMVLAATNTGEGRRLQASLNGLEQALARPMSWKTNHGTIARTFLRMKYGIGSHEFGRLSMGPFDVMDAWRKYQRHMAWAFEVLSEHKRGCRPITVSLAALVRMVEPSAAEEFARGYATLEDLKAGSPALALRRWEERSHRVGANSTEPFLAALYCLKAQVDGAKVNKVFLVQSTVDYWHKRLASHLK